MASPIQWNIFNVTKGRKILETKVWRGWQKSKSSIPNVLLFHNKEKDNYNIGIFKISI